MDNLIDWNSIIKKLHNVGRLFAFEFFTDFVEVSF